MFSFYVPPSPKKASINFMFIWNFQGVCNDKIAMKSAITRNVVTITLFSFLVCLNKAVLFEHGRAPR